MMVLIESEGSKTPVVLIDGQPDLSMFSGRTLEILKAAFDFGSYKTIEGTDFGIQPQPLPDWNSFMLEMDTRGLFMFGLTANFAVFTQIFNMLLAMRDKQSLPNEECVEWRNFKLMYTLGRGVFSNTQLAEIEAAMIAANIPLIQ